MVILEKVLSIASGSKGGGGGGGLVQGVGKNVKGVQCKVQNYFLRVVLSLYNYIFTKINFSLGGMPPDPLSYGMSDVNPHLTLM